MANSYGNGHLSVEERFWSKVDQTGGDSACWEWRAGGDQDGYGIFYPSRDKGIRSHRFSWMLRHGDIPAGLKVLHACDNPSCVNPSHLSLGTDLDNVRDMDRKGRRRNNPARGEANGKARLTIHQVMQIRARAVTGDSMTAIAREYGVTKSAIRSVVRCRTWRHVQESGVPSPVLGADRGRG